MDRTINHVKNTFWFLDDILIVSKGNEIEHEKLVETVLKQLNDENLALKISKCEFFKQQVNWLGHHPSESGVSPHLVRQTTFGTIGIDGISIKTKNWPIPGESEDSQKGELSRDTSPLHKQQVHSDRDRQKAKAHKELLEVNAHWSQERRYAAKNDIRRIVDETGLSNPELRKEMIYSCEKGFIEDKEKENTQSPQKTILRKHPLRKSGQALSKQLKGKITAEMDSMVKTSTGSIYRKSDITQAKTFLPHEKTRSGRTK